MTCIAYKDGVLAADTCVTEEDGKGYPVHRSEKRKLRILNVTGGTLALASRGDTGSGDVVDALVEKQISVLAKSYVSQGRLNAPALLRARKLAIGDSEYEGIAVFFKDEADALPIVYIIGAAGYVEFITGDTALGCDAGFARAAMDAGAGAIRAVELAARYGVYTGLPIDWVRKADGGDSGVRKGRFSGWT